jgi:hypothetical protein
MKKYSKEYVQYYLHVHDMNLIGEMLNLLFQK